MPLFKFNLHAAVMPSFEVDGVAVQTTPYSEADVEFPLILVSGAMAAGGEAMMPLLAVSGRMEGIAEGEVIFPLLVADGEVAVPVQIEGAASFPFITVSGSMQVEASIEMPCLRVLGDVLVGNRLDGEVSFPLLMAGGVTAELPHSVGDVLFPLLAISAEAEINTPAILTGDVTFSVLGVSGAMQADGDVSFPTIFVSGLAVEYPHMTGNATFPALLVSGSASQSVSMTAVGNVIFPHFQVAATVAGQGHQGQGSDSVLRYADNRRLI